MNTLDFIIMVVFLGVFTAAFFAGVARSLAGIGALFIATVAAAIFYKTLGDVISEWFIPIDRNLANFCAFLLLMLGAGVGADYLLLKSFRISKLRSHVSLEFRGGVTGIFVLILISAILSTAMVTVLTQTSYNTSQRLPDAWGTTWLSNQFYDSTLAGQDLRLAPYVFDTVDTLTPGIVPAILEPVSNR